MIYYGMKEKLANSKDPKEVARVMQALSIFLPNWKVEEVTDISLDKMGCDYIATSPDTQVKLAIDHKSRDPGCLKYWRNDEPDFSPEIWSKLPEFGRPGVVGWTLDPTKITDWILCTFNPVDTTNCYLIPYKQYRAMFIREKDNFIRQGFQYGIQDSGGWKSQCVFIPVSMFCNTGVPVYQTQLEK